MKAIKTFSALVALFSISSFSAAISETNYEQQWSSTVEPFFEQSLQSGYFVSDHKKLSIFYGLIDNTSASRNDELIVILPGKSEPFYKYSEVAWDLYQQGYSLAFMDHRGQGGSGRLLNDTEKGHVSRFSYFADDVEKFMTSVLDTSPYSQVHLLAHSMGGLVGAMVIKDNPELFDDAVLSSPMMMPSTSPLTPLLAMKAAGLLVLFGQGNEYAPGQSGYSQKEFAGNELTSSEARFAMKYTVFNEYPEFQLGGVTNRWLYTTVKTAAGFENSYSQVSTPVLMLRAGDDSVVLGDYQEDFCDQASACDEVLFSSAKHEILMESDSIRDKAMSEISHFFAR